MTLADLRLPPVFVTDHCIRTLFYQGPMSPVDLAKHWRVHPDIAVEAVDSLKAAALVEVESGQSTFERLGRVRLNGAGQAYVAQARSRTWYAGPLPVSLESFEHRTADATMALAQRETVRDALTPFHLEDAAVDEIGQAMAGGATISLAGVAPDEQPAVAAALGQSLADTITVPYAIYASGAVIRVFDRRSHRAIESPRNADVTAIRSAPTAPSAESVVLRTALGNVVVSELASAHRAGVINDQALDVIVRTRLAGEALEAVAVDHGCTVTRLGQRRWRAEQRLRPRFIKLAG